VSLGSQTCKFGLENFLQRFGSDSSSVRCSLRPLRLAVRISSRPINRGDPSLSAWAPGLHSAARIRIRDALFCAPLQTSVVRRSDRGPQFTLAIRHDIGWAPSMSQNRSNLSSSRAALISRGVTSISAVRGISAVDAAENRGKTDHNSACRYVWFPVEDCNQDPPDLLYRRNALAVINGVHR
jgi:hypothetical protein